MTTLLSWVSYSETGEEPHLPRAIYLASDSRITWGSAKHRWEAGRKVFAPASEPHLFGFTGDVVLPALMLGQIVSAIDAGILFGASTTAEDRHSAVLSAAQRSVASAIATPTLDFKIHHLMREHAWPNTTFRAWIITWKASNQAWTSTELAIPSTTEVIGSFGSGSFAAESHRDMWQGSEAAGLSRAIFASFCDSVRSGDDRRSGGPPQLGALYTKGNPAQIGMAVNGRRFMNGLEVDASSSLRKVQWRDELGQEIDPVSGKVAQGARRFGRPNKLARNGPST